MLSFDFNTQLPKLQLHDESSDKQMSKTNPPL